MSEIEKALGPATPMRVENALFLQWSVNYADTDLRDWYADAMSFYECQIQGKETLAERVIAALASEPDLLLRS